MPLIAVEDNKRMDEYLRAVSGVYATIIEKSGEYTYIAEAKEKAVSASEKCWRVRRVRTHVSSGGVERTTVAFAGGHSGFVNKADSMASLTYADY